MGYVQIVYWQVYLHREFIQKSVCVAAEGSTNAADVVRVIRVVYLCAHVSGITFACE